MSGHATGPCATPDCPEQYTRGCTDHLCGECCRQAQLYNGTVCEEHPFDHGGDDGGSGTTLGGRETPSAMIRRHIGERKILSVTSPLLFGCAHSLLIYELEFPGRGVDLIARKAEGYRTTHQKYPDDCAQVVNYAKMITQLLTCTILRHRPIILLNLIRLPLRLLYAIVHVRATQGLAASRVFASKTDEVDDVPDDYVAAMPATAAAASRAHKERRERYAQQHEGEDGADGGGRGNPGRGGHPRGRWNKGRFGRGGRGNPQGNGGPSQLTAAAGAGAANAATAQGQGTVTG